MIEELYNRVNGIFSEENIEEVNHKLFSFVEEWIIYGLYTGDWTINRGYVLKLIDDTITRFNGSVIISTLKDSDFKNVNIGGINYKVCLLGNDAVYNSIDLPNNQMKLNPIDTRIKIVGNMFEILRIMNNTKRYFSCYIVEMNLLWQYVYMIDFGKINLNFTTRFTRNEDCHILREAFANKIYKLVRKEFKDKGFSCAGRKLRLESRIVTPYWYTDAERRIVVQYEKLNQDVPRSRTTVWRMKKAGIIPTQPKKDLSKRNEEILESLKTHKIKEVAKEFNISERMVKYIKKNGRKE